MGEGVDGLEGVMNSWRKFEGKLNGQKERMKDEVFYDYSLKIFQKLFKQKQSQMEIMKSNTGFKCKEFEAEVTKFKKKWASLRRGNEGGTRQGGSFEDIQMVKEMSSEFEELAKSKDTLWLGLLRFLLETN